MEKDNKVATSPHQNGAGKCPFMGGALKQTAGSGTGNRDWWPNQLKLNILRQNSSLSQALESMGLKTFGSANGWTTNAIRATVNWKIRWQLSRWD